MVEIAQVIQEYEKLRMKREKLGEQFLKGERPYMIFQTPNGHVWGDVRNPEQCFEVNLKYIQDSIPVPSDHLPVLEPWFGTGVIANMYGCPYIWRDGEAPATHYKYHTLDEIKGVKKPHWQDGEVGKMVIETIQYFKKKTGNHLPIVWTDTQSACDIATLILDATEVFIGCLIEPETMMKFMTDINDLVIEFSHVQEEAIGEALLRPGHIMLSNKGLNGMSIADDNLAVGSPAVNSQFNLPLDEKVGQAMGGLAIHSCGQWTHTMPMIKEIVPSCIAIDCAIDETTDPNPNAPEKVRDALKGTGIYVHARLTGETDRMIEQVKKLIHPDLKVIIHPSYIDQKTAEKNYEALEQLLSDFHTK